MKWLKLLQCAFVSHDYTSAVEEGLDPTTDQIERGIDGFWEYSRIYCKRCGYKYPPEKMPSHQPMKTNKVMKPPGDE